MLRKRVQRSSRRGQALVEFAMVIPIIFLLLLGTYDFSIMGTNQLQAYGAARHAARVASLKGGFGTPGVTSPKCYGTMGTGAAPADSTVDDPVVQDLLGVTFERKDTTNGNARLSGLAYSDVTKVVIYRPQTANNPPAAGSGAFNNGTDHANVYQITSTVAAGITKPVVTQTAYSPAYPLGERCQGPLGSEAEVGVEVTYTYRPAFPLAGVISAAGAKFVDYAVEKETLCDSNCNP